MKVSKILQFTFVLIVFLLFVKTDFRIINELRCCQDDFDYYSHAATIAKDFDFDYSNQINSTNRFYVDGKVAPIGFLGAGLLASPFLWVGTILDSIEYNCATTAMQVDEGRKELVKAEHTQRAGGLIICIYFLMFMCVLMTIIIILQKL